MFHRRILTKLDLLDDGGNVLVSVDVPVSPEGEA
jgi:hypothetical protein